MSDSVHIVRGDSWGLALRDALADAVPGGTRAWMQQHTQLLKSDTNSCVGLLHLRQDLCCLKFYQPKSAPQRWLFRAGRGRAVHSFDVACQLAASQVVVPQPRACVRVPDGMLLLTRGIADSQDMESLWSAGPAADEARQLMLDAAGILARLHCAGHAHGDCKWRNLLCDATQIYLVDLDAVSAAVPGSAVQARDLARFTLNAEELDVAGQYYELFLGRYVQLLQSSRETMVARMLPALRKLRARHRVKYGERGQRLL